MDEINTLGELMRAISQANFGGYDTFDLKINQEHSDGGFLIISVTHDSHVDAGIIEDYVGKKMFGEFWFWADDTVMQVL